MRNRLTVQRYMLVLLLSVLVSVVNPHCLIAQTPAPPSTASPYELAIQALGRADHKEALNQIQKAIAQKPGSLDFQYVLGIVYIQLKRFSEAEAIFHSLLQADPKRYQVSYFDLASIYAQQGNETKVQEMLKKARPLDPGRAEFETGLSCMRSEKYADSIEYFKRAALLKPELAGESSIQQGIALLQMKRFKEAKATFEEALKMKLSPERIADTKKLIEAVDLGIYANKPWQVMATVGFQYNDNLFSSPLDAVNVGPNATATNEKDTINLTSVAGRYNFYQEDAWKFGATYTHFMLTYMAHSRLNVTSARPSVFVNWEKSPYYFGTEYALTQFWTNGKVDTQMHSIIPRFAMLHGSRWRTETAAGVDWRLNKDMNFDASHSFWGFTESFLMQEGRAHVRAGYLFAYDDFVPEDQADFLTNEAILGTQWPIWKDKWFLDVAGLYIWRNYDHDVVLKADRKDDEQNVIVQVFGQLTPYLQLALGYQHTWNDSNITQQNFDPFRYTRALYTCMLTFNY